MRHTLLPATSTATAAMYWLQQLDMLLPLPLHLSDDAPDHLPAVIVIMLFYKCRA
jgi:hypothetical protein